MRDASWRRYLRFWRPNVAADVDDELQFHFGERIDALVAAGLTIDDARRQAQREFGDVDVVRRGLREIDRRVDRRRRLGGWLADVSLDLQYAFRSLRRQPGYAVVVAGTLALGIGANSAIFSVVNAVLLEPLPYRDAARLVRVWPTNVPSKAIFVEFREYTRSFTGIGGYGFEHEVSLLRGCSNCPPMRVAAADLSANLFAVLGIGASVGRAFAAGDDQPGSDRLVLLSNAFWREAFGSDPSIVGTRVTVDGIPRTVVGIAPPSFALPTARTKLWLPATLDASKAVEYWWGSNLAMIARLRRGVTLAQASADVRAAAERARATFPVRMPDDWGRDAVVAPLRDDIIGDSRPMLVVLFAAVLAVLLVACANVANLTLARGAAREREVAIRGALGAGRNRVVRQLLTESVVLGVVGAAAGLAIAHLAVRGLLAVLPSGLPRVEQIAIDGRVLAFTVAMSIATVLGFGLMPALRSSRADLRSVLAAGSPRAGGPRRRASELLVVAQIALAVSLVAAAGLLIKSLWLLHDLDPGFRPDRVVAAEVPIPSFPRDTAQRGNDFYQAVLSKSLALGGVRDAAIASTLPFGVLHGGAAIDLESHPTPPGTMGPFPQFSAVTADYFRVMGIPVRSGRVFGDADREGAPQVAVVDERAARKFWPNEAAIGQRLRFVWRKDWVTVVGVVGDVRRDSLTAVAEPSLYVPFRQNPLFAPGWLLLRTAGDTPLDAGFTKALRAVVASVDATVPLGTVRPLRGFVNDASAAPRFTTVLLGLFAVVALVLGAIGIYGVVAYSVARRTREIGVRMALGAKRGDVLGMVLGEGARLAGLGVLVGFALAFAAGRLVSRMLYGVSPADPMIFVAVPAVLALVAAAAALFPALRASRVDPVIAIRES